jgi:proteic killer suppression protein
MRLEFRTKLLERCYRSYQDATRQWGAAVARRYIQRLDTLYAASTIEDLYRIPPLRFHLLKGNRQGQYAVALTDRVRLIVSPVGETGGILRVEEVNTHYGD